MSDDIGWQFEPSGPHPMTDKVCEHKFVYQGMTYRCGHQLPGSSATSVEYFETYFCEKCLTKQYHSVGDQHDSYQAIKWNATPRDPNRRY